MKSFEEGNAYGIVQKMTTNTTKNEYLHARYTSIYHSLNSVSSTPTNSNNLKQNIEKESIHMKLNIAVGNALRP